MEIPQAEIIKFQNYQRRIFFLKADLPDVPKRRGSIPAPSDIANLSDHLFGCLPDSVDALPKSVLHSIYRVTFPKPVGESRAKYRCWIFRINSRSDVCREFLFYKEQRIMELLHGKNLPHLPVWRVDLTREDAPFDYEVVACADGATLFDLASQGDISPKALKEFGRLVRKVHAIPSTGWGPLSLPITKGRLTGIYESWPEFLLKNLSKHIRYLLEAKVIGREQAVALDRSMTLGVRALPKILPSLLHGDLSNHNTFCAGKRISALVDWEDSISGDPLFDVAYYATGCYGRDAWFAAFWEGYREDGKKPKEFESRLWLYYLRIALAKAVIRHRYQTIADRKLPDVAGRIEYGLSQLSGLVL